MGAYLAAVWNDLRLIWELAAAIGAFWYSSAFALVLFILQDPKTIGRIRIWMDKLRFAERYRDLIKAGLGVAERFYGQGFGPTWRGYLACLVLAFIYPVVLWMVAWAGGGPGTIGGQDALNPQTAPERRWFGIFLLCFAMVLFGLYLRNASRIVNAGAKTAQRLIDHLKLNRFAPEAIKHAVVVGIVGLSVGAIVAAVVAVAAVVVVAGGDVVAGVAGVMITTVGVVGAVGAIVSVGKVGAVAAVAAGVAVGAISAVVAGVTLGGVVAGVAGGAVVYLTFLVAVPIANAALDHVSVQFSRWLLADLVKPRAAAWQSLAIAGHVVADVVVAILCLTGLAILLPTVVQFANLGFGAVRWPTVEWGIYLNAARASPFGAGVLVVGMLATTLVPTILHLLAAGGALLVPRLGGGQIRALARKAETAESDGIDRLGLAALIGLSAFLSWAALVLIATALWEAALLGGLIGPWLAQVAVITGQAIAGIGPP